MDKITLHRLSATVTLGFAGFAGFTPAYAADAVAASDIKGYLVDIGAGHIAANEIIGLSGSAVSNLQTPKDLVAALAGLGDPASKNGFGLAWSPGRSGAPLLGVSASHYAGKTASPAYRLWGSTTFSWAQNTKTVGGLDYRQSAVAINVAYYPKSMDDPVVVGYRAFGGIEDGPCGSESEAFVEAAKALLSDQNRRAEARRRALGIPPGGELPMAELQKITEEAKVGAKALTDDPQKADKMPGLAREIRKMRDDPQTTPSLKPQLDSALGKLSACAKSAEEAAAKKWNATHVDIVAGQGWIRGIAAGSERLALGRHLAVALAWSSPAIPDGLVNLTLKRIDREIDLDTLTTTPVYKGTTTAALRYTHKMGAAHSTYALGEVSNVKTAQATTSNAAFKWAFGVDHQLRPGTWLELRAGRARSISGGEENKALLSLKLSPEATLPNAGAGN